MYIMKKKKNAADNLFEIVESQQGYFTTKQAIKAGYADNTHSFHVKSGNWIREERGIYHLKKFPQTERPDLVLWSLWSRDRNEKNQGVYSHQTALSIHELSDIMPSKLHMTIPVQFRKNKKIPGILILHKGNLKESDIVLMQGFQVTTPLRTIMDLVVEGTLAEDFLVQAVREAFKKGLIMRSKLKNTLENISLNNHLTKIILKIK